MTFAGDGTPVSKDGELDEAQFQNPLGVAFSPEGKFLFVSQAQNGALRRIRMPKMPISLKTAFESVGFLQTKQGIKVPNEVQVVTFFETGKEKVAHQRVEVRNGIIPKSKFPFDDFVVRCKIGKKTFGFRKTAANE